MIVKPFLVISMAAFYLSVMPRCCRPDCLMRYMQTVTQRVQRVNTLRFLRMGKLAAIICLDQIRCIAEVSDCTLYKIYCSCCFLYMHK